MEPHGGIFLDHDNGEFSMSETVSVLQPSGILDSTKVESFRQQVDEALAAGADIILVDLQDISFIDSSGLGALVVVLKKVRAVDRRMYICSVNDQVRMLFELTSMDQVFNVLADRAEFEAKVLNAAE